MDVYLIYLASLADAQISIQSETNTDGIIANMIGVTGEAGTKIIH